MLALVSFVKVKLSSTFLTSPIFLNSIKILSKEVLPMLFEYLIKRESNVSFLSFSNNKKASEHKFTPCLNK
jgi:hypothetical protein